MSVLAPIVILGTGLAGYSIARELRKIDSKTPVLLVTEDGGEFYSKPTLSNAFGFNRTAASLVTSTAEQMEAQLGLTVRGNSTVRTIDPAEHRITFDDEVIAYSRAVLAIGAKPHRLGVARETDGVYSVNSLDDYRRFRSKLDGCQRIVILGAGFIGCEFANDLRKCGIDVDVVDVASHPLSRFWPAPMAVAFQDRLAAIGVNWHLGRGIAQIYRDADCTAVELIDGTVLRGDLVLSALGLAPRIDLAAAAGLGVGRGIRVDGELRATVADIFALGDCAEVSGQVLPFVMPIMYCARALARTLSGTATQVSYPPMPVVLKTPACPCVFIPPPAGIAGEWCIEQGIDALSGVFSTHAGEPAGVALLGAAVNRRDEFVRILKRQPTESN